MPTETPPQDATSAVSIAEAKTAHEAHRSAQAESGWTPAQWTCVGILALLCLWNAVKGWRVGPVRQLSGITVLFTASAFSWLAGPAIGRWLLKGTVVPWILRGPMGIAAAFLVAWLLLTIWFSIALARKDDFRTEHPALGALAGCMTGMIKGAWLLLALGSLAGANEILLEIGMTRTNALVSLRDDIGKVPGLGWIRDYHALPDKWPRIGKKARELCGHGDAFVYMLGQERIRDILTDPVLRGVITDQDVVRLASRGDFAHLANHPKVRELLEDDEIQRKIASIDLEASIDEALEDSRQGEFSAIFRW